MHVAISQGSDVYQKNLIIRGQVATGDFTWNPQNFAGFYYDLDSDVGTEELTTTLTDGHLSGSEPFGLSYQTTAQEKPFSFQGWGSYSVVGFLGRERLAGYQESMDADENLFFQKSKDANSLAKGCHPSYCFDDDVSN